MRMIAEALFAPWRMAHLLASRTSIRGRFKFVAIGLLLAPAFLGLIILIVHLASAEAPATALGPPQAGLMAALSKGIVQSQSIPLSKILLVFMLAFTAWVVGSIAAGAAVVYGGGFLLGRLLGRPILGAWLAAFASLFLPLAVVARGLWALGFGLSKITDSGISDGVKPAVFIAAGVLTLWLSMVFGSMGWTGARAACSSRRVSPPLCAAATILAEWLLAIVASNLAWLPIQLVRPLLR